MFLKTADTLFAETFGMIWPVLFSVLISIFNNELIPGDLNLKLAALKLLEMTMLINYENIYLHYWSFGFDTPEVTFAEKDDERLRPFASEFSFLPFLTKLIKRNVQAHFDIENKVIPDDYLAATNQKRKIIVKTNKLEDENELSELAFEFLKNMVKLNTISLEIDENEINEIIMQDFIRLNEFISS